MSADGVKKFAAKLDLHTVGDLLQHYPRRYATRGELTDLSGLVEGEDVTVVGQVSKVRKRSMQRRRGTIVEVQISDGVGHLSLTFFNQAWRETQLAVGTRGLFAGTVSRFNKTMQLTHPEFIPLDEVDEEGATIEEKAHRLIPVYPSAAKLETWKIAKAVQTALVVVDDLPDPVPAQIRERRGLLDLATAYRLVHEPDSMDDVRRAQERLRFDEAFVLQVVLAQRRRAIGQLSATPRVPRDGGLLEAFDARMPFTLTDGQQVVGADIAVDLARAHPMHRLLQGEVGSGKTVVAVRAMLAVVDSGGQAALLAPTEVLAQQHLRSITELLGPLAQRGRLGGDDAGTTVTLLTGSQSTAARRQALLDTASGDAGIVVGTHALLQEHVDFFDLGLVVVDEQHRFGVEQRDALRAKAERPPHVLVMTATPIPRTVAMTVFGDLEVSTLTELPAGRSPITTHVVPTAEKPHYVARTWQRLREEVDAGHQAYVVAPRIGDEADGIDPADTDGSGGPEPDETSTARRPPASVLDLAERLVEGPLAGLKVGVLHGRLPADAKDDVMQAFAQGRLDVLVATTVVEVGVDVANATVMVIVDADRFGVSQLHQLRGRVGRGHAPGLCLLVTEMPPGTPARERLDAVAATADGFVLSQLDLQQRREGDVLGTSQAGRRSSLRLLRVLRDESVIVESREEAQSLVGDDPQLVHHGALAEAVNRAVSADRAEYLEKA
ncbi:MAG: ATP-dependent DNA helicase RecG [Actinomycetes bacterium]